MEHDHKKNAIIQPSCDHSGTCNHATVDEHVKAYFDWHQKQRWLITGVPLVTAIIFTADEKLSGLGVE
jgi:hypothetical protein